MDELRPSRLLHRTNYGIIWSSGAAAMREPMLAPKSVVATYESILGRQPESNDVVRHHVQNTPTIDQLERSLISSQEFFQKIIDDGRIQDAIIFGLKNSGEVKTADRKKKDNRAAGDLLWSRAKRSA